MTPRGSARAHHVGRVRLMRRVRLSSRVRLSRALTATAAAVLLVGCGVAAQPQRALRVCADPNNLPFSNERGEGFENRIAELIAQDMNARVEYTWHAQRRGFIRNTLRAGECDLVPGVPSSFELALATRPYYRSTYVFVTREDRGLDIRSLDDERLRTLRVGVQVVGDDYANSPPAHALGNRGIVNNIVGYSVLGDYNDAVPTGRILDAVTTGDVDVAVVWGPLAGWYTKHFRLPLRLEPVEPQIDVPFLPFVFDIAMGVRREDVEFRDELDAVLVRRAADIDAILDEYGVPRLRGASIAGARRP